MATGEENGRKLLPLLYLIGAGSNESVLFTHPRKIVLCTAAINKWRSIKKSELRHQQHRRLLEEPSKPVD